MFAMSHPLDCATATQAAIGSGGLGGIVKLYSPTVLELLFTHTPLGHELSQPVPVRAHPGGRGAGGGGRAGAGGSGVEQYEQQSEQTAYEQYASVAVPSFMQTCPSLS